MQVDAVRGDIHSVVQLIARSYIELEVWAHGRFNSAVQSLLDLLADLLVIVASSQLLVKLVVGGRIEAFYHRLLSGGCGGRLVGLGGSFATEYRKR